MRGLLQRAGAAVTGDPEYRPGDLTRGAVGAVGGGVAAVFEGVAHAAGATDYRFGDVSRAVSGGLSEAGVVVGGATISFFESFQENNRQATAGGEATEAATRLGPDVQANVTKIWSAFFGQCYEEGAAALRQGELQPDDVLDREVFFFIGLPARTLLGTCLRTLDAPPDEPAALRLSEGLIVTEADVHPELKPLFDGEQHFSMHCYARFIRPSLCERASHRTIGMSAFPRRYVYTAATFQCNCSLVWNQTAAVRCEAYGRGECHLAHRIAPVRMSTY